MELGGSWLAKEEEEDGGWSVRLGGGCFPFLSVVFALLVIGNREYSERNEEEFEQLDLFFCI